MNWCRTRMYMGSRSLVPPKWDARFTRAALNGSRKCQCEMGGKNPIVVLADADLQLAMESVLAGAFASTGQRCTATSRVVIEESVADKFVAMLVERAKKYVVGDGLEPGTDTGPSVDEAQFNTVLRYIEIGKGEGKLLCGGERITGPKHAKGWFVSPAIFDKVAWDSGWRRKKSSGPC